MAVTACDTGDGTTLMPPEVDAVVPPPVPLDDEGDLILPEGTFAIASPAFSDQGLMPARFTISDGSGVSPPLEWAMPPDGTAELALVVTDVAEAGAVHWVLAGLEPTSVGIVEGQVPPGAVQALNDFGVVGWTGPAPPGDGVHTYVFSLHALSEPVDLPDATAAAELIERIDAVTIATAEVAGLYE